jgi:hypothetical protein
MAPDQLAGGAGLGGAALAFLNPAGDLLAARKAAGEPEVQRRRGEVIGAADCLYADT